MCADTLGHDAVDDGTLARTRSRSPGVAGLHRPAQRSQHAGQVDRATREARQRILLDALDGAGISDRNERAMFLAQMYHESDGFRRMRENLHYSAARLRQVFPRTFTSDADARSVAAQGEAAIAERIYGNRARLGNATAADGARYIGRGFVQLTGRNMYASAGAALGRDLVHHPELAEDPATAARIAIWYWRDNNIGPRAQAGDVTGVTRAINGGTIGLAERARRYREYLHDPTIRSQREARSSSAAPPSRAPAPRRP
jgi:putative chitinase